jgi:hypothetical protein
MKKGKDTENKSDLIRQYLIKNPDKINKEYTETAKLFEVTYESIRHICRRLRTKVAAPKPEKKFVITEEVIRRKENSVIKSIKRQLEQAVKDYQQLSDAYDVALNLKSAEVSNTVPVLNFNEKHNKEATAIIQISDGHFGKIIVPSTVNGLNSYNPDIAKKRMEVCAKNAMSLIKKERADIKIDKLVLILGGDFLENSQRPCAGSKRGVHTLMADNLDQAPQVNLLILEQTFHYGMNFDRNYWQPPHTCP